MSPTAMPGQDCPPPASYEVPDMSKMTSAFMENTTAHGLARIAASRTKIRRGIWILILAGALVFMGWQLNMLINMYLSYPIAINTRIENMPVHIFPAVTVCNMNAMKRDDLVDTDIYGPLVQLDEATLNESSCNMQTAGNTSEEIPTDGDDQYNYEDDSEEDDDDEHCDDIDDDDEREFCYEEFEADSTFTDMTSEFDWCGYLQRAVTTDLSDLVDVYKPTIQELLDYGTPAPEFIVQCSFDKKNCTYKNFTQVANGRYGMCYTFNSGGNQTALITRKYGSRYGLRLTLYIDREEYVGMFSPRVGVVVAVHHRDTPVFPEDSGIVAAPGMETVISVRQEKIERLEEPYPSNCSKGLNIPMLYSGNYTVTACSMSCLQTALLRECHCNDHLNATGPDTRCSAINETQMQCRQLVYVQYGNDSLVCDCRPPCGEVKYHATVSSAAWPSARYMNIIRNYIWEGMEDHGVDTEALKALDTDEELRNNVVRIQVYLDDQSVRIISETPAYPWERLLADLGGLLGLFMGISICSAMEVLEFCMDMVIVCVKKRQRVKKTGTMEEANPKP